MPGSSVLDLSMLHHTLMECVRDDIGVGIEGMRAQDKLDPSARRDERAWNLQDVRRDGRRAQLNRARGIDLPMQQRLRGGGGDRNRQRSQTDDGGNGGRRPVKERLGTRPTDLRSKLDGKKSWGDGGGGGGPPDGGGGPPDGGGGPPDGGGGGGNGDLAPELAAYLALLEDLYRDMLAYAATLGTSENGELNQTAEADRVTGFQERRNQLQQEQYVGRIWRGVARERLVAARQRLTELIDRLRRATPWRQIADPGPPPAPPPGPPGPPLGPPPPPPWGLPPDQQAGLQQVPPMPQLPTDEERQALYHFQQLVNAHAMAAALRDELVAQGMGFMANNGLSDALTAAETILEAGVGNYNDAILQNVETVLEREYREAYAEQLKQLQAMPPPQWAPAPPPPDYVPPLYEVPGGEPYDRLGHIQLVSELAKTVREAYQFLAAMRRLGEYGTQAFETLMDQYKAGVSILLNLNGVPYGNVLTANRNLLGTMSTNRERVRPAPPPAPDPSPGPLPAAPPALAPPPVPAYEPTPPQYYELPRSTPPPNPDLAALGLTPLTPVPVGPSTSQFDAPDPRLQATTPQLTPEQMQQALLDARMKLSQSINAAKEWLAIYGDDGRNTARAERLVNLINGLNSQANETRSMDLKLQEMQDWTQMFNTTLMNILEDQGREDRAAQLYVQTAAKLKDAAQAALQLLKELARRGMVSEAQMMHNVIQRAHFARNAIGTQDALNEALENLRAKNNEYERLLRRPP